MSVVMDVDINLELPPAGKARVVVPKDDAEAYEDATPRSKRKVLHLFDQAERNQLRRNDFERVKKLGSGASGNVQLVYFKGTDKMFAMKVFSKHKSMKAGKAHRIVTERDVLASSNHPFIVTLYGSFTQMKNIYLLEEYCQGGDFFRVLRKFPNRRISEHDAKFYSAEILSGLAYLHSLGFVYRDLKPENILVTREGHLRLADFDLSKAMPKGKGDSSSYGRARTNSLVGTEEYIAPEIILGEGHDSEVDWWTYGIMLYEMVCGFTPFHCDKQLDTFERICTGEFSFPDELVVNDGRSSCFKAELVTTVPEEGGCCLLQCFGCAPPPLAVSKGLLKSHKQEIEPPKISSQCKRLIRELLTVDSRARLGSAKGHVQIQQHDFFSGLSWDLVEAEALEPPWIPPLLALHKTDDWSSSDESDSDKSDGDSDSDDTGADGAGADGAGGPAGSAGTSPKKASKVSSNPFHHFKFMKKDCMAWEKLEFEFGDDEQGEKQQFFDSRAQFRSHSCTLLGNRQEGLLVVFGLIEEKVEARAGQKGSNQLVDDVYCLDMDNMVWSKAEVSGKPPAARWRHSATAIEGDRIVIFGGHDGMENWYGDAHILRWDKAKGHTQFVWEPVEADDDNNRPAGRDLHTAALITAPPSHLPTHRSSHQANNDHRSSGFKNGTALPSGADGTVAGPPPYLIYVFGGWDGVHELNDLWVMDPSKSGQPDVWRRGHSSGMAPSPRSGHSSVVLSQSDGRAADMVCIFGGYAFPDLHFNDTHILNAATMQWTTVITEGFLPSVRCMHASYGRGNELHVFGGCDGQRWFNDLYEIDLTPFVNDASHKSHCKWRHVIPASGSSPAPRAGHTIEEVGQHWLVFGGGDAKEGFNDMYMLHDIFEVLETKEVAQRTDGMTPRAD